MQKFVLSLFLGGMVAGIGLFAAPAVHANTIPDGDQLEPEITQQTTKTVNTTLEQNEVTADKATQSTPASQPTPTSTPNDPLILNTGSNADIDASQQQNTSTTVANSNQADVDQEVTARANTGDNTASRNISFGGNAGVISTGDATVYNKLSAAANSNKAGVTSNCPGLPGYDGSLTNTGANLDYDASTSKTCSTTITNGNGVAINQVVDSEANTGGNRADGNIAIGGGAAGLITTGDAEVSSILVTRANENVVLVGGSGGNGSPGNGANIYLVNTGRNATIHDRRTGSNVTNVASSNSATIDQVVNGSANTGDNTSNGNIAFNGDAGVITTGDATVVTKLETDVNHNKTSVATGGNGSGGGDTSIVNTGNNLDADISSQDSTETTVTNSNSAEIDQNVEVEANTGRNTATGNIAFNGDAGVITTGDATVVTELSVEANSNETLIANGGSGDIDSTNDTSIVNTGNNADIDLSTRETNETTVHNHNTADVTQDVEAVGNTGDNTVTGNIGNTSIQTGDVRISTEVITNANNNYTFIIDSEEAGFALFKHFVSTFLGIDWEDLISNGGNTNGGDSSIVNTGNNATILAENVQTRSVVVNNTNNATVTQNVIAKANTGGNSCDANVGDCAITTGDAVITTRLIANLNNNFTFIGNVQLPEQPETPETPETPEQPEEETPVSPEEEERPGLVLGEDVERPSAVLAATTLPMTGGSSLALIGSLLVLGGAGLQLRAKKA